MPITNVAFLIAQLPTTLCGNLIQARGGGLQPSLDASPPPSGSPRRPISQWSVMVREPQTQNALFRSA